MRLRRHRPRGPIVGTGPTGETGQATVELVLSLPVVVLVLLLVVQVGVVARSQVLVVDAARQGARSAAVGGSVAEVSAAARATPGLVGGRIRVTVTGAGGPRGSDVAVTVRYREPTDVALVGGLLPDRELTATVTMRLEEPP
ncbi:MAG: hypothetical protein JWM89_1880 [Acidimicrobiales bacterium]|nr:hypothetical protein [Acidimicrobiales bacterium]